MLRVIATPSAAAISSVRTDVTGIMMNTRCCTRRMFSAACACSSAISWSTFSTSEEVRYSSGRTWFAMRRWTALQSR
jgi:hypothetical protein